MARIVFLGLTITSSWGNGHATTYRALVKALAERGHEILFLERDKPWYRDHRDLKASPYAQIVLYEDLSDLKRHFASAMAEADAVIVGSFVPDGIEVGTWATATARGPVAFYDIDTPVTLAKLERGACDYLSRDLLPHYDLYLSFTGGPVLDVLRQMGSPRPEAFYCSVDPQVHGPVEAACMWELGYLGTYSPDRQPGLDALLLRPAKALPSARFAVAGAQFPSDILWPENVTRIEHLPPAEHPHFYCGQRFTLNVTRDDMKCLGYSPSVRLFEAAACGVPIISDEWAGLDSIFRIGSEILIANDTDDVLNILANTPPHIRDEIAGAARLRVLREHTATHRAIQLEELFDLAASDIHSRQKRTQGLATS